MTSRAVIGRVRFEPVGEEFLKFATSRSFLSHVEELVMLEEEIGVLGKG